MASATTIITDAMQDLGVLASGGSPTAADLTDCLRRLNNLLASWSTSTLLVPFRTQVSHTLDGSQSYTIGSGATISATRPTSIESAFVTYSGNDYPVRVGRDRSEYDRVDQKDLTGIPFYVYYEPAVPTGTLYVYYVGDSNYTLYLNTRGQLTSFPDTTTDVDLAPGYDLALQSNLAILIAPMFETTASAETVKTATESLAAIKRLNRQEPVMQYDQGIPGGGSRFNIEAGY